MLVYVDLILRTAKDSNKTLDLFRDLSLDLEDSTLRERMRKKPAQFRMFRSINTAKDTM